MGRGPAQQRKKSWPSWGSHRTPHRLGLGTWRLRGLRSVLKQSRLGAEGRGFRSALSWGAGVDPACIGQRRQLKRSLYLNQTPLLGTPGPCGRPHPTASEPIKGCAVRPSRLSTLRARAVRPHESARSEGRFRNSDGGI